MGVCRDERDSPWRDVHGRTRKDAQGRDMQWPGIDGSDDGYEAFANLALLYCLGGEEELDAVSRRQWEAVTRQFTEFGTVHDEFDGAYDWMHHGESSQILYFLGLANPHDAADRCRSLKFSELYIDEAAGNWNAKLKMIKSPLNGSRGALTTTTEIDWCTHRDNLSDYLCPFEDHPALAMLPPSRPRNSVAPDGEAWDVSLDWNDDAIMDGIIEQFNARQTSGDVPLNLLATSLVTHAFLLDPPDKAEHKAWVLEYLGAWEDRAAANAGILPDNIGETGVAGEHMGGKWWGGYYGYRWPHGVFNLLESILVAGCNACLLSHGDSNAFTLYRQQCDLLWSLGLEGADDGIFRIPARHSDAGWCDYREPKEIQGFDRNLVLLYHCTQRADDLQRLTRLPGAREGWPLDSQNMGKGGTYPATSWHAYVTGKGNTEYPLDVLEATLDENERRVQQLKDDDGRTSHVTQWASLCPVCPHGLLQLICGTPGAVYHGGLVHARLMPFDPVAKRPGLPPGVALLVHTVQLGRAVCSVVNTDAQSERILILQVRNALFANFLKAIATDRLPRQARTKDDSR